MARLRDYTQSLMRPESAIERDEEGNLIIRQVEDVDPYQAGIQAQESMPAPLDPDAKPIFMTNIPQGGFGPSYENPGGVPGSEQDRAQMDEQAKAAGSTVMDLSEKQKMPKKPEDWVGSGVDLNAPGVWEGVWQNIVDDVAGGTDLTMIEPNGYVQHVMKIDPSVWPDKYKKEVADLSSRIEALNKIKKSAFDMFKYKAGVQAAVNKRKAESEKGKFEAMEKDEKRLLELSGELVKLAGERRKLKKDQTEAGQMGDPTEMVSINRLNAQVDSQQKSIQAEISRLEERLGRKAPAQAAAAQPPTTQTPTGKPTTKIPASGTPQQTEAQKFALYGKSQNWSPEKTLAEWKKLKTSGAGTKTPAARQTNSPARIVKPAPTSKPSGVTGSWGPPPPSASQVSGSGINIGGPPVTINTKDMAELADSVGINKENLDTALKAAAKVAGITVDTLLLKRIEDIKKLLKLAAESQSKTRKQMGL